MSATRHNGRTAWCARLWLGPALGALVSGSTWADTVIRETCLPGLVAWEVDNAFARPGATAQAARGELLLLGFSGLLYGVDAESGEQRWRFAASVDLVDCAFVSPGHVIAVDRGRRLVWLDKGTARPLSYAEGICLTAPLRYRWTDRDYVCAGMAKRAPAPGGKGEAATDGPGMAEWAKSATISSYELAPPGQGEVKPVWQRAAPGLIPKSLAVVQAKSGPGVIVFCVQGERGDTRLRALSFKGGEPVWQSRFASCALRGRLSVPLRAYGTASAFSLIAATEEGAYSNVYRIDVSNGSPRGGEEPLVKLHGRLAAPPAVGRNGTTFVWTRDGQGWVVDAKRQKVARIDVKAREFHVGPALGHDQTVYSYAASGELGTLALKPNPDLFLPTAPLMWEDERLASRRLLHLTSALRLDGAPLGPPQAVGDDKLAVATVGNDGQARLLLVAPGQAADNWRLHWTFTCSALARVDCFLPQADAAVVFGEGVLCTVVPGASASERVPVSELRGYSRAVRLGQDKILLVGTRLGICGLTPLRVQAAQALPLEPGESCVSVGVGPAHKWACVCTDRGRIACLDLGRRAMWSEFGEPLPTAPTGDPVVVEQEAFVASGKELLAFRLPGPQGRAMRPERTFSTPEAIVVQPVRAGHRLFWATSTSIYSIDLKQHPDARECVRVFDSDSSDRRFSAIEAASDDRLCAAFGLGVLVLECHETPAGVRLHSGARSEPLRGAGTWRTETVQMAVVGDTVCIAAGRWVYGLYTKTGDVLWHVAFPSRVAGLTTEHGAVLACSLEGTVKCIRPPSPADIAPPPLAHDPAGEEGSGAVFKPPRGQPGETDETDAQWATALALKLRVHGRPIDDVLAELLRDRKALRAPDDQTVSVLLAVKDASMGVYLEAKAQRRKGDSLGLRRFFTLSGKSLSNGAGLASEISKELDRAAKNEGFLGRNQQLKAAKALVASISFYLPKLTEWSGEARRSLSAQDAKWWDLRDKVRPFDLTLKKLDKWSRRELDSLIAGYGKAAANAGVGGGLDPCYERGYLHACQGDIEAAAKEFEGVSPRDTQRYSAAWWIMGTLWWQQNDMRAAAALSRVSPDFERMTDQERALVTWLASTRRDLLAARDLSQVSRLTSPGMGATPARSRLMRFLREEKFLQSWGGLCPLTVPIRAGYRHFRLTIETQEDMRLLEPALKMASYTRDKCLEDIVLRRTEPSGAAKDAAAQSALLAQELEKALLSTYGRQAAQLQAALDSGRAGDWSAFMERVRHLAQGAQP